MRAHRRHAVRLPTTPIGGDAGSEALRWLKMRQRETWHQVQSKKVPLVDSKSVGCQIHLRRSARFQATGTFTAVKNCTVAKKMTTMLRKILTALFIILLTSSSGMSV